MYIFTLSFKRLCKTQIWMFSQRPLASLGSYFIILCLLLDKGADTAIVIHYLPTCKHVLIKQKKSKEKTHYDRLTQCKKKSLLLFMLSIPKYTRLRHTLTAGWSFPRVFSRIDRASLSRWAASLYLFWSLHESKTDKVMTWNSSMQKWLKQEIHFWPID